MSIRTYTYLFNSVFPIKDPSDLFHRQTLGFLKLPPSVEEEEDLTSDKDKVVFPSDGGEGDWITILIIGN
jgi:hypothetical protein